LFFKAASRLAARPNVFAGNRAAAPPASTTMALSLNDVARIAHLARIEIGDDAGRAMLAQLNDIFAMIEKMQRIDTTGVAPMAHPLGGRQRLREDRVTEANSREQNMSNAPESQDGLFLVPRVVE
jgi:aspartyl-tRNA(Asn)/glutamyl-tRNA(Gln) amidotransferase subunit C